jgi:hypothetical protein
MLANHRPHASTGSHNRNHFIKEMKGEEFIKIFNDTLNTNVRENVRDPWVQGWTWYVTRCEYEAALLELTRCICQLVRRSVPRGWLCL